MALNENLRGGLEPLPFPLDQKRSSTYSGLDRLLGRTYKLKDGLEAILVKCGATVTTPDKSPFKWSDTEAFTVIQTTETTDFPVGVAHPSFVGSLASGDYFHLMRFGHGGRVTVIAEGNVTAGNTAIPAATTGQVDDSGGTTITPGITLGKFLDSAGDSEAVDILLVQPTPGANA